MNQSRRLDKLEALRGVAALYVLVHHFVHSRNELASLQPYFILGQFSLLLFFILSGFVIHYSVQSKEKTVGWGEFVLARFRRIYPIFILAMLTNYLLACLGSGTWVAFQWQDFLLNLGQLQDDNNPYGIAHPFMGNHPLWSLSYEWWFYMLYYPTMKLFERTPHLSKWAVGGFSLANVLFLSIFPNGFSVFFAYYIIWWCGVELAKEFMTKGKITLRHQFPVWALMCLTGICWALHAYDADQGWMKPNIALFPFLQMRHFVTASLILFAAWVWQSFHFFGFKALLGRFVHLAPISYALYIVHLPIIHFSSAVKTGNIVLDFLIFAPLILMYAWLLEQPFQRWVNSWMRLPKT